MRKVTCFTVRFESNVFILIRQYDVRCLARKLVTINVYVLSVLAQTNKNFPEDRNSPTYLASERSYR